MRDSQYITDRCARTSKLYLGCLFQKTTKSYIDWATEISYEFKQDEKHLYF